MSEITIRELDQRIVHQANSNSVNGTRGDRIDRGSDDPGRIIVLPCEIGSEVYTMPFFSKAIISCIVQEIVIQRSGYQVRALDRSEHLKRLDSMEKGKKWWLTREDAEAALIKEETHVTRRTEGL